MFLFRPEAPLPVREVSRVGRVSLVGAGPGDPELLTLKAAKIIAAAEVILHDQLVSEAVLDLAPAGALRIDVGKRCGLHSMDQQAINDLIVAHARTGAHVVRLKGGDPFLFGRGGEELAAVRAAGLPVQVIPGITAACAAAAGLQIPLTDRYGGRSLHLVAGHGADDVAVLQDWARLAGSSQSLVIYMGARRVGALVAAMLAQGVSADLPALAVAHVGSPRQQYHAGKLAELEENTKALPSGAPILLMIGQNFVADRIEEPSRVEEGSLLF